MKPIGVARVLSGFEVAADSVVATATIRYSGSPSEVTVRWGDNTSSTRNPSLAIVTVGQPTDPPGVATFKHASAAPADGSAFTMIVTGQAGNESDSRIITVTPRYRVIQYQAYFAPVNHCDSPAEEYTEWRIGQSTNLYDPNANPTSSSSQKSWRTDRSTGFTGFVGDPTFDFRVLDGSMVSRELTATSRLTVTYDVTEIDPISDDAFGAQFIDLSPRLGSRSMTLVYGNNDCGAKVKADVDVELLKPGLNSGGQLATLG